MLLLQQLSQNQKQRRGTRGKSGKPAFFHLTLLRECNRGGSYNRIAHRGLRMQRGWEVSDRWDGLRWVALADWLRRDSGLR